MAVKKKLKYPVDWFQEAKVLGISRAEVAKRLHLKKKTAEEGRRNTELLTALTPSGAPAQSQELTPWFPADVKPVHIGWYHTDVPRFKPTGESSSNWWWDGVQWKCSPNSRVYDYQNRRWRGRTKP